VSLAEAIARSSAPSSSLHAQQAMGDALGHAFRRLGQHVRDHVADRATGVVERFDGDDVVDLCAQFARAEDRGRRAVGHAHQVQRADHLAALAQRRDRIGHVARLALAVTGGCRAGAAMVAQVQGNRAVAGLRELQRPRQQRAAVHHPAVQQHHRAARRARIAYGRGCIEVELHAPGLGAIRAVGVVEPVGTGIERAPEQLHASGSRHPALPVRQPGDAGFDARGRQDRRDTAGRDQALAEHVGGVGPGEAGQQQAGAQDEQRATHGRDPDGRGSRRVGARGPRIYRIGMTVR
jgi:hypothetical protein